MSELASSFTRTSVARAAGPFTAERDLVAELNAEHEALCRHVATCLAQVRGGSAARPDAFTQLAHHLELHMQVEEDALYPALARDAGLERAVEAARIEHGVMRHLMSQLCLHASCPLRAQATLEVLAKIVRHHVEEEAYVLVPLVRQSGLDVDALAAAMRERRRELDGEPGAAPRRASRRAMRSR